MPVTADDRRLGVLVLGLGRRRTDGDLISLDEPGAAPRAARRPTSSCSGPWAGRPGRRWSGPGCTRRRPGRRERSAFLLDAARLLAAAAGRRRDRGAAGRARRAAAGGPLRASTWSPSTGCSRPVVRHRDPAPAAAGRGAARRAAAAPRSCRTRRVQALRRAAAPVWVRRVDDELLRAVAATTGTLAVVHGAGAGQRDQRAASSPRGGRWA